MQNKKDEQYANIIRKVQATLIGLKSNVAQYQEQCNSNNVLEFLTWLENRLIREELYRPISSKERARKNVEEFMNKPVEEKK